MPRLLPHCIALAVSACITSAFAAPQGISPDTARGAEPRAPHPRAGHARPQVGKASIYSHRFAGRRMANGERMDPHSDNAASKTLPLGTRAVVKNLDTGRSAVVTIEDRGPFVAGRIVDLSPATAAQIGLTHKEGVAPVEVVPIAVPDEGKTLAEK